MRIWHFSPQFPPFLGGQEKGVFNFIRCLSDYSQLQLTIFTTTRNAETIAFNGLFRVIRSPGIQNRLGTLSGILIKFLKAMKHDGRPELIHAHFPDGIFILPIIIIARLFRIPTILHVHLWPKPSSKLGKYFLSLYSRLFLYPLFHLPNFLISPNEYTCKQVSEYCHKKFVYRTIPYGLNQKMINQPIINRFRTKKKRILFLGRIHPQKRLDRLIHALNKIPEENRPILDIYGDGEDKTKIDALILKLSLNEWIYLKNPVPFKFVGQIYSLPDYKLFVLPTDIETYAMVIVESLSYGLPVLTTNIEELNSVYGDNILYSNPSPESFAKNISLLLEDFPKLKQFQKKGYQFIKLHPTWEDSSKEIFKLYKKILHVNKNEKK